MFDKYINTNMNGNVITNSIQIQKESSTQTQYKLIFMNKAHPWIGILTVEEANEEAKEEEGSMLEENNEDEISA